MLHNALQSKKDSTSIHNFYAANLFGFVSFLRIGITVVL